MFFSKPKCPVEPFHKSWAENALRWFIHKLGKEKIVSQHYIVPGEESFHFSDLFTDEAVYYFKDYVCRKIGLDPSLVRIRFIHNEELVLSGDMYTKGLQEQYEQRYEPGEDGMYELGFFTSSREDFDNSFFQLVYTLCGIKLIHEGVFDFPNGHMFNLAMVLLGFGVIAANSYFRSVQWKNNTHQGWRMRKIGFINHPLYGYIFALLALYKGEKQPAWESYLCKDVKSQYLKAQQFLDTLPQTDLPFNLSARVIPDEEVFFVEYFYENEALRQRTFLKQGLYEGLTVFYHSNGGLWSERIYRNGIPWTVLSNYDKYGASKEKGSLYEGDGSLYVYDNDGGLLHIEEYKNGVKRGANDLQ